MTFRTWQLTHSEHQPLHVVLNAMTDADLAHLLRFEHDPEVYRAAQAEAAKRWLDIQMPTHG